MSSKMSRRTILAAPALLTVAAGTVAMAQDTNNSASATSSTLVAYFTRSGNTRVIAGTLQRDLGADLFEIVPAEPYPEDYEQTVEQATRERDRGFEPRLTSTVPDVRAYDTIFLGFPIWGGTAPPVIRSFLKAHDLRGKTIRPFITHGGFGIGSSLDVLTEYAMGAQIAEPFVMEADQERRTLNQVRGWLSKIDR